MFRQARDICAVASTCRRLHGEVRNAPHLFERSARAQTAVSVLAGVTRRASVAAPELLILLRQKPLVSGPRLEGERGATETDWRRGCLLYEEQVLREHAKRCGRALEV